MTKNCNRFWHIFVTESTEKNVLIVNCVWPWVKMCFKFSQMNLWKISSIWNSLWIFVPDHEKCTGILEVFSRLLTTRGSQSRAVSVKVVHCCIRRGRYPELCSRPSGTRISALGLIFNDSNSGRVQSPLGASTTFTRWTLKTRGSHPGTFLRHEFWKWRMRCLCFVLCSVNAALGKPLLQWSSV